MAEINACLVCVCVHVCVWEVKAPKLCMLNLLPAMQQEMCVYMSLSVVFACVHHESLAMPLSRRLYFKYISIYIYICFYCIFRTQLSMAPLKGGARGGAVLSAPLRVTPLG